MVIFVYYHSSEDDGMAAEAAQVTRPVLGCLNTGSVNDELICSFVESGSRQKTGNV